MVAGGETERRRGLALPFLPGVRLPVPNPLRYIPNPLAWVPLPRILGGGKRRSSRRASVVGAQRQQRQMQQQGQQQQGPASTSAALGGLKLAPASAAVAVGSRVPLKPLSDVFCGALARAASQSTIHPLDTLKVRLQTNRTAGGKAAAPKVSAVSGLSKIGQLMPPSGAAAPVPLDLKTVGKTALSLYKGVVGAASGAGIAIGAYFAFYGVACNILSQTTELPAGGIAFAAGGIAALGSSFVKVPLAVCIRSVQAGVYPNFFAAGRSIVQQAGPRGLFTGYLPTVLEDVPDMAIKFAAYESMRQFHAKLNPGRPASVQEDFAMGAVSGALAAAATTPLDVIKTNMMCTAAQRPSMMGAAAAVYAQGGAASFFRGIGTRAASNGINSAVFFVFFEMLKTQVAKKRAEELEQQKQKQLQMA